MARSKMILQSDYPYHVGARCINREWFSIPMPVVWQIMSDHLYFIHHAFGVRILGFILMSNHFHLIIQTPRSNLSEAMSWFMRETSRDLARAGNRINQSYGGRYFRSILRTEHYYLHAYKYLYLNSVKGGLARRVELYPFSTLNGMLGFRPLQIPVEEDTTLFSDIEGTLSWLNRLPKEEDWIAVQRALRRKEFKLAKVKKRNHELEVCVL